MNKAKLQARKERAFLALDILDHGDYDREVSIDGPDETKAAKRLIKAGLLEKCPGQNRYRRTEAGDALILTLAGRK